MAAIPCDSIVAQETSGPSTSLGMTVWGEAGSLSLANLSGSPGWLTPLRVPRQSFRLLGITTVKLVSHLLAVPHATLIPLRSWVRPREPRSYPPSSSE